MKKNKISIIIASYNNAKYMEQCLKSVMNQTMSKQDYEVIIIDDCSNDESITIIKSFMDISNNIVLIEKKRNEGLLLSRLDGMKKATGDYIAFLDSDDWLEIDMLEKEYAIAIQEESDITEFGYFCENNKITEKKFQLDSKEYDKTSIIDKFSKREFNTFLWLKLFKRDIIKNVLDYWENSLGINNFLNVNTDDEFLYPMFLTNSKKYYVSNKCFYHYRTNRVGSITNENENNNKKKMKHAFTLIQAGSIILDYSFTNAILYHKYLYLQTNNFFYLIGTIYKDECWEEILKLNKLYRNFSENYLLCNKRMFFGLDNKYLIFRNVHLFFKITHLRLLFFLKESKEK